MEPKPASHVLLELLLDGPSTAKALAGRMGIDVAAVRRHLEDHVASGRAQAAFRHEGVGRPRKYYEITSEGRETLPRRYDLLVSLLMDAVARERPEEMRDLMETAAQRLAADLRARVPPGGDLKTRTRALVQGLRALGFPTDLETRGNRLVIRRRDCVFLRAAEANPDAVCRALDTRMLALVLGEDVALRGCLPEGSPCCVHEIDGSRNN